MDEVIGLPKLNKGQKEQLEQLFFNGPTWHGDLISKDYRTELIKLGLAYNAGGFTNITVKGIHLAVEYGFGKAKIAGKKAGQNG